MSSSMGGDPLRSERVWIEELKRHAAAQQRYAVKREIAHGGMGSILEVWEGDLGRNLAMKVIRTQSEGPAGTPVDPAVLQRFLDEAQVTAQLSHPGVVPVHELSVDDAGRVYFTMPLVRGHDLERVFADVRRGEAGWSQERVLALLLKACETMAYAHSRGVIHRDLKPANVMVGEFGEVYVMDWGLARFQRVASGNDRGVPAAPAADRIGLDRGPVDLTMAGAVVGTPAYMSPEQARGEALDARSDVYAMGAILYTLLSGKAPYVPAHGTASPAQIVGSILRGPPSPVSQQAPGVAPELAAIAEKAMNRAREERYPDMQAMAADLGAFLEGRVVRAYRTGPWVEFRKWVKRNRGMAAAFAALLVSIVGGAGLAAWQQNQARRLEQDKNARILGLADTKIERDLRQEELELWPALPGNSGALVRWVEAAESLHSRLPYHRETRALLAASPDPGSDDVWLLEQFDALIAGLTTVPDLAHRVGQRRDLALSIADRTVQGEAARAAWRTAIDDIARLPAYQGLVLAPQLGLLPLGRDQESGLWEFWHVLSGAQPGRDGGTGRWRVDPETALILVLLPGGSSAMGSQRIRLPSGAQPRNWAEKYALSRESQDYGQPFHDPGADRDETFFERVELEPLLVSKFELTQAQAVRALEANPSQHHDSATLGGQTHPVEGLSWHAAQRAAARLDLALPTEAQWEYACRAGRTTPFATGEEFETLQGHANLADRTFVAGQSRATGFETPELEDGFVCHAPVGSFQPNAFGLHDMHGNVWEWCLDRDLPNVPPRAKDGLRETDAAGAEGVIRGGSWNTGARDCRCANRLNFDRNNTDGDVGVRLVRALRR